LGIRFQTSGFRVYVVGSCNEIEYFRVVFESFLENEDFLLGKANLSNDTKLKLMQQTKAKSSKIMVKTK
jgi:hypothetical protein